MTDVPKSISVMPRIPRSGGILMFFIRSVLGTALAAWIGLISGSRVKALDPCCIRIVDQENGWPVPLVELRTTHQVRFVSDNAGLIALDLPELMGVPTWFFVTGHGYDVPADGFGYRGIRLTPHPGKTLTVKVTRRLPAKRLGRITGAGLFAESQKLGRETGWKEQGIFGCDSVQTAIHNGKMYWAWGDTLLAKHPLGLFHMLGATTPLQPLESFEPPVRLRYRYLTNSAGQPRVIAPMPGSGPTWINGCISLPDVTGRNRLVCSYIKIKPPLTTYASGLSVWNEQTEQFDHYRNIWTQSEEQPHPPPIPNGHATLVTDEQGEKWVLFGDPFPRLKCRATWEAWSDPETWEHLTPQKRVPVKNSDQQITPHRGSIAWNDYRKKWVTVFTQKFGKPSILGEIWYAEADSPTGPWKDAVKIVTHENYSFYNPKLHPEFTPEDSAILLFEGTYTATFANHPNPTPRHNYNQVLYRLDLDDPRLVGDSTR